MAYAPRKPIGLQRVERGRFEVRRWARILPKRRENKDWSAAVSLHEAQVLQTSLAI